MSLLLFTFGGLMSSGIKWNSEIFLSRDYFSLLTALLSLKDGVGRFIAVPENDAGVMIVWPETVPVRITIYTQHNRLCFLLGVIRLP